MIAESLRIFDPSVSGDEAEGICLHQRGAMAPGVVGICAAGKRSDIVLSPGGKRSRIHSGCFRAGCIAPARRRGSCRLLPAAAIDGEEVCMASMKKEEARRAVLSEYDRWAKKAPQRRQDDGRLSVLSILTERKVGPSRFPCGWRQVANRSRLAPGSVGRLTL